jgi:hypothetical protein
MKKELIADEQRQDIGAWLRARWTIPIAVSVENACASYIRVCSAKRNWEMSSTTKGNQGNSLNLLTARTFISHPFPS